MVLEDVDVVLEDVDVRALPPFMYTQYVQWCFLLVRGSGQSGNTEEGKVEGGCGNVSQKVSFGNAVPVLWFLWIN